MVQRDEEKNSATAGGANEFEMLFEESLRTVKPGGVVKGRVVGITSTHVLIDVGYKSEGGIPIQEFSDRHGNLQVKVGDEVDVFFDPPEGENGGIVLSRQRAENIKLWEEIEKAYNEGLGIEGHIVGKVKGGFRVDVGVPGFLPGSHVDIRPSRNLDRFIGTTDRFVILKYNRARGNVVVSRRALLEKERDSLKKEILKVLEEGVILEGTVKNITGYGAFVDLGGIDGILHISDMSWGRINHPTEVVHVGEKLKVVVLKFDPEKERISLGIKQLTPDPWHTVAEKYPLGSRVQGKVISLMDYGAFVELERKGDLVEARVLGVNVENERFSLGIKQLTPDPWKVIAERYPAGSKVKGQVTSVPDFGVFVRIDEGVEGLIHVSQLSVERIDKPSSLYKVGDEVEAEVINIDVNERKIGLSIRALRKTEERQEMENYLKREKEGGRFSFESLLNDELRLDRDEEGQTNRKGKGGNP